MLDYTEEQQELLEDLLEETKKNQKVLENIFKGDKNVNTSIYGLKLIEEDTQNLVQKYENFYDDLYRIQKHKFRFQVAALILFILITAIGKISTMQVTQTTKV